MLIGPLLFGGEILSSFFVWSITELVNYIAILPVILTMPALPKQLPRVLVFLTRDLLWRIAPLAVLALSLAAAWIVGGPGSLAFPVPALLWCAITYSVFWTAALTLLFSASAL